MLLSIVSHINARTILSKRRDSLFNKSQWKMLFYVRLHVLYREDIPSEPVSGEMVKKKMVTDVFRRDLIIEGQLGCT